MNNYVIELEKNKQLSFRLIYSLGLVELKILKMYIETNLANNFIQLFKSPVGAFIFFDWKSDGNLHFYVDYRGFNYIIINNWYPLSLISKLQDWLGRAKRFI